MPNACDATSQAWPKSCEISSVSTERLKVGIAARNAVGITAVAPIVVNVPPTSTVVGTAVSVSNDMTEGIIARFRTMAIHRPSVLVGHVVGSVIQTMLGLVVVIAVALLIGFRPTGGLLDWIAAKHHEACEGE